MNTDYSSLLQRLLAVNVTGGMKFGLDNVIRLSAALGDPHHSFKSVHVAGTNGKGSVTTKIAAGLQASGMRVGLYTSPHISCFRERIRINQQMISEGQLAKFLRRIFHAMDQFQIPATFFEITTVLAFAYFAEEQVDFAAIETGLGGRLDATNIVTPQASVITSISLEHTEYLGDSIESIAKEKAGIIKPTVPVVIGPRVPKIIIDGIAVSQGSPCIAVTGVFTDYHAENNAVARRVLELLRIDLASIELGLQVVPPCRLEIALHSSGATIVLDAAHNPDGLQSMLQAIKMRFPHHKLRVVVGLSSNKDIVGCLQILKDEANHFYLVEANSPRAISSTVMRDVLMRLGTDPMLITDGMSISKTLSTAVVSLHHDEIIVVCGTFFILGEVRHALGMNDPQDPYSLNERLRTH